LATGSRTQRLTCKYSATIFSAVPLKPATFRLETELLDAMQTVRERDGVPVSEQVRRGIVLWLEQKGLTVKTKRKRTATRTQRKP
jgi:hypothetical protein